MPLQILGLNHNTAPVELREQVVFAGDDIQRALNQLKTLQGVEEAVLLSTCNRTEFYVISAQDGREQLKAWLHNDRKLNDTFAESLFMLDEEEAIRHIFRVACGLDSMVLGEPQILGQLKDAYRHAQDANTLGSHLSRLLQHTFSVAKKIRTDTEIGASPVSAAYAAVNLAQQFSRASSSTRPCSSEPARRSNSSRGTWSAKASVACSSPIAASSVRKPSPASSAASRCHCPRSPAPCPRRIS